ncbi:MAG: GNAT family N-acetyltransferase [Chloroflexi bacterium]|nr:GNAT family N-acetyltransferase [Chloroflexota bacterium]
MGKSRSAITLRLLTKADLPQITAIHMSAFPHRAMTALGSNAVQRYYDWLLTDVHPRAYRMGAFDGEKMLGFNFAGRYNGALSGFLDRNRNFLIAKVATRPWLLLTNELFRSRISIALRILSRKKTPARLISPDDTQPRAKIPTGFGILAIAVDPLVQGKGVGKLLMLDAEREAKRLGHTTLDLSVDLENSHAIEFYERLGWQKFYVADGSWQGTMVKILAPPTASPGSTGSATPIGSTPSSAL